MDVDELTLLSLDGVGIEVIDEVDGWELIQQDCDPSTQSCPPQCDPQYQTCPVTKSKLWVKPERVCCNYHTCWVCF